MSETPLKNKEYTMQKLLNAVESILCEEGHQGLGVNRIAQHAGVSKALIYRYFGGLEGLLRAYGETDSFWPAADEIRGMSADQFKALPLKDRCRTIFRNFRSALKKRPHTVAIYAWEMVEPHDIARDIISKRTQSSLDLVKAMMGQSHKELTGYDHEITTMIGAALLHMTMRESLGAPFAGLDLDSQETWDRFDAALETLFIAAEHLYQMRK